VTKLDGTSRGGALVGIWRELRLPIFFVGLGEEPEDLQAFSAADYADAVFGLDGANLMAGYPRAFRAGAGAWRPG
jgi:fused signal recognition particle receptor